MLIPRVQDLPVVSGASFTTLTLVENFKNMMLYVPAVSGRYGAATVEISIKGAYSASTTALDMSIYNYGSLAIATAKVTAGTAGFYEMPFPGSVPFVQFAFNTVCTGGTTLRLVYND